MDNVIDLQRLRKFSEKDIFNKAGITETKTDCSDHYSVTLNFDQDAKEPKYVDKYKQGSTNRMRGYWEVHGLPDYQMDEQGGPGLQGFTEVHSHRFKLYFRASLEKEPEAAEAVKDHELEHQLDPYASESEVRARTNTTSSNPHFSYRLLWSY